MRILQKITALIMTFAMMSVFVPVATYAADYEVDQFCENEKIQNVDGYWKILSHQQIGQTFKPSVDTLAAIIIAAAGDSGPATINMRLFDTSTGLVVATKSATALTQISWVTYNFDPHIKLDTNKTYKISLTTASSAAYWAVSTVECYGGGTAIVDGDVEPNQDFGFATYGYDSTPPAVPEAPAVDQDPAATPDATATTDGTDSTTDVKIAEVDATIAKPVLTRVTVNDNAQEISEGTALSVVSGDKVNLYGTTANDTKVTVFVGLASYEAVVGDNNEWSLELNTTELGNDELVVQGQALKGSKVSEKEEFLRLKVAGATATVESDTGFQWNIWYTVAAVLTGTIIGILCMLLWHYLRDKKKSKKTTETK